MVKNRKKIPINTIMDHFSSVNSEDIQSLVNKSKNLNTTKTTSKWMRVFNSWAALRGKVCPIFLLFPIDLDKFLHSFYTEVKKTNGDEYEPNSLPSIHAGIDRYLKENNYHVSVIVDRVFLTSRDVLDSTCKNLREHGKGKRPNKSNSSSESLVNVFWKCGQLGTRSPMSLINTIWLLFTLHFRLRGQQEHHSMTVSDFQIKKDDFGNEFVTFVKGVMYNKLHHEKNDRKYSPSKLKQKTNKSLCKKNSGKKIKAKLHTKV